jgi:hypothetical protein
MNNIDRFQLSQDGDFRIQIAGSLIAQCCAVWAEDPSVAGHTLRMKYANNIILVPNAAQATAQAITPYLTDSSVILANVDGDVLEDSGTRFPDADVDTIVASLIDFLAGVTGTPPAFSIIAGSMVQLIANSLPMTVESVAADDGKGGGPCATCLWLDSATHLQRQVFLLPSLLLVN